MIAPLFLFVFSSALAGFAYLISGPVLSDLLLLALIMALGSLVLLTVAAFNRPVSTKISSPAKIAPRRVQVRKLRANPKPVSYTHIDVYKRQLLRRPLAVNGQGFRPLHHPRQPRVHEGAQHVVCLLYTSRCV